MRQRRRLTRVLAFGLICGVAAGLGCAREPSRPNVVLVILDTVRRDHTGCGGGQSFTPRLDRLMAEGTGFVNAWATAPWTPPSHASFLTGLLASEHLCCSRSTRLRDGYSTFAEHLGAAGYETVAFFSNPWLLDDTTGVLRGFDEKFAVRPLAPDDVFGLLRESAQGGPETVANIKDWLARRTGRSPFLMFVNFLEPHLPYDPPASYRAEHLSDIPPDDLVTALWAHEVNARVRDPEDVDWDRVRALYAGDTYTADDLLGQVVDELERRGLLDDTVIIVTSDHGENLGEHGFLDHQFGVFETLLAVPLVVRAPGRLAPGIRSDPVMLTDIYATVLDAARIPDVPTPTYSRSLLGPPAVQDRPLLAEYAGPPSGLLDHLAGLNPDLDLEPYARAFVAVKVGDLRLTVGTDDSRVLNDLATDPLGLVNLAPENPGKVNLLIELMPGIRPIEEEQGMEIDEEMREWLRSLGYVM